MMRDFPTFDRWPLDSFGFLLDNGGTLLWHWTCYFGVSFAHLLLFAWAVFWLSPGNLSISKGRFSHSSQCSFVHQGLHRSFNEVH